MRTKKPAVAEIWSSRNQQGRATWRGKRLPSSRLICDLVAKSVIDEILREEQAARRYR